MGGANIQYEIYELVYLADLYPQECVKVLSV